jgi:ribosomal-protein-alanine N-acetyltransferase
LEVESDAMTEPTVDADHDRPVQVETKRLLVRTMLESDLPEIFACYDHPEVAKYTPPIRWPNLEHATTWYHRRRVDVLAGRAKQFVIVAKDSERVIGTSVLFNIDATHRNAEIGYALGRDFWGQGFVREAVTEVIDYAFAALQLHRLNASIDPRNTASANVLLRFAFTHEGTTRQSYFDSGEFTDCGLYGLLVHEWRKLPVGADRTPSSR